MRVARVMAAVSFAIMLTVGMAVPGRSLARPARALSAQGLIFAGTASGHVYRSVDGAATWHESDAGLPAGIKITSLAVAASESALLYAGTDGGGVFASSDGGARWHDANGQGGPANGQIVALAVDPHDARHLDAAEAHYAVYGSGGGGRTWSSYRMPFVTAHGDESSERPTAIAIDPQRPSVVFLGTYAAGLFVSMSDGESLYQTYAVPEDVGVNAISSAAQDAGVAYAATSGGLYRTTSDFGGASASPIAGGLPSGVGFTQVIADPRDDRRVTAVAADGAIYRSLDAGSHWTRGTKPGAGTTVALIFDPADVGQLLAAQDTGRLFASSDSGLSWAPLTSPTTGDIVTCLAAGQPVPLPTDPEPPPASSVHVRYFPLTRHTLRDPFLRFWDRNGDLAMFGYPLTEAFVEVGQTVQYFQRARLSLVGATAQVSPLGLVVTAGRTFAPVARFTSTARRLYFASTGHTLASPFLAYWRAHQGSLLIGPPISEPLREANGDGTGRIYLVQYFQNMRLEYHPELAGVSSSVAPGLIGVQVLHQRGWL